MEVSLVYILYSESIDKYYVGYSSNVQKRLEFHNSTLNKNWTKRGAPWVLVFTKVFDSKEKALKAERFIKKQKSRKFIEKVIQEGWLNKASDPD